MIYFVLKRSRTIKTIKETCLNGLFTDNYRTRKLAIAGALVFQEVFFIDSDTYFAHFVLPVG